MTDFALDPAQRKSLRAETLIAAAANAILPAVAMALLAPFPMALWGANGMADMFMKNALGPVMAMTVMMTLGVRARVRKGAVAPLAWKRAAHPVLRFVPQNLALRAGAFALAALIVVWPLTMALVTLLGLNPISRPAFAAVALLYGAAIGLLAAPAIVVSALSDQPGRIAPAA